MNEQQTLFILQSMINEAKQEILLFRKSQNKTYLMQAGEKVWNATTQLVNLNRIQNQLPVSYHHEETIRYIRSLELCEGDYNDLVRISQQLHRNFYTGKFIEYEIVGKIKRVEGIINKKLQIMS